MPIARFPDPRRASPEGLLAVGGDLHPDSLLLAYRSGIFPWPIEGMPLPWFCPPERAILEFSRLHIPRSLRGARNRATLRFSVDEAFGQVIRACADTPRYEPGRKKPSGTWITREIVDAYSELARIGHAHSVEAWDGERLVAGIYGVEVDGTFSAESMFHLVSDASKLCLWRLIEELQRGGAEWLDVQMMTPHVQRLGARPMKRDQYLKLLKETHERGLRLFQK